MNLPIQSAPVMRGQDRGTERSPLASSHTVAQSGILPGGACLACSFLPPPYRAICELLCKVV
jgi:hypothetical protein